MSEPNTTHETESEANAECKRVIAVGHRDAYVARNPYSRRNQWEVHCGPVDLSVEIPKRGDPSILFSLRIAGYAITAWETGRNSGSYGHTEAGVVARKNGEIVFLTNRIGLSPAFSVDGPEAKSACVGWVAHELNDDELSMAREERFGEGS